MNGSKTIRLRRVDAEAIVAQIDLLASQVNGCYSEMSPGARLVALELAKSLHRLRIRLTVRPRMNRRALRDGVVRRAARRAEALS